MKEEKMNTNKQSSKKNKEKSQRYIDRDSDSSKSLKKLIESATDKDAIKIIYPQKN